MFLPARCTGLAEEREEWRKAGGEEAGEEGEAAACSSPGGRGEGGVGGAKPDHRWWITMCSLKLL